MKMGQNRSNFKIKCLIAKIKKKVYYTYYSPLKYNTVIDCKITNIIIFKKVPSILKNMKLKPLE